MFYKIDFIFRALFGTYSQKLGLRLAVAGNFVSILLLLHFGLQGFVFGFGFGLRLLVGSFFNSLSLVFMMLFLNLSVIRIGIVYHFAVKESYDTVGILLSKLGVVSNHNNELVGRYLLKKLHNLHAGITVQRARRLVCENYARIVDERSRNGYSLHLTAGKLIGLFVNMLP